MFEIVNSKLLINNTIIFIVEKYIGLLINTVLKNLVGGCTIYKLQYLFSQDKYPLKNWKLTPKKKSSKWMNWLQ